MSITTKAMLACLLGSLAVLPTVAFADDSAVAKSDQSQSQTETMRKTLSAGDGGDRKIAKAEYMAYYEKMWLTMKKDKNGMIDLKSMGMGDGMMQNKATSKDSMSH